MNTICAYSIPDKGELTFWFDKKTGDTQVKFIVGTSVISILAQNKIYVSAAATQANKIEFSKLSNAEKQDILGKLTKAIDANTIDSQIKVSCIFDNKITVRDARPLQEVTIVLITK